MHEIWQQAKQEISVGELSSALTLLAKYCTGELEVKVTAYQGELARIQQTVHLWGGDVEEALNKLRYRVLQFIILQEQKNSLTEANFNEKNNWKYRRRESLERQLEQTYELITSWEDTCRLASDPTEEAKAKKELVRLKRLISEYLQELALL